MSRYEVIPYQFYRDPVTGETRGIGSAFQRGERFELVTAGWTVRNPLTGEQGTGRKPFETEAEAQAYADKYRPSRICIGD